MTYELCPIYFVAFLHDLLKKIPHPRFKSIRMRHAKYVNQHHDHVTIFPLQVKPYYFLRNLGMMQSILFQPSFVDYFFIEMESRGVDSLCLLLCFCDHPWVRRNSKCIKNGFRRKICQNILFRIPDGFVSRTVVFGTFHN